MDLILDVQGFKTTGNQFVFKEFVVLRLIDDAVLTYFFRSPFPWSQLDPRYKCENMWVSRHYHGIPWESGDVPYDLLQDVLQNIITPSHIVYVKGKEKQQWLIQEFPGVNFTNLEDLGCPSLQTLKEEVAIPICSYHTISTFFPPNCATQNVRLLKHWFSNHIV